jgi:hypothetical protein
MESPNVLRSSWQGRGRIGTVDPLVPTCSEQLLFKLKIYISFSQKTFLIENNCTEPSPPVKIPWSWSRETTLCFVLFVSPRKISRLGLLTGFWKVLANLNTAQQKAKHILKAKAFIYSQKSSQNCL